MQYKNVQIGLEKSEREWIALLASPDALEVIVVSDLLTESLSVSTDLTDVTVVSDDTIWHQDNLASRTIWHRPC